MSKLIQICGLPRSGTAFISVLLSMHPECIAYHELISKEDDYKKVIAESLLKYKYVADCTTYGFIKDHSNPQSKKVFIDRNITECLESSKQAFDIDFNEEEFKSYQKMSIKWIENNRVYIIRFEKLFTIATLQALWLYCFGSEKYFDEEKVRQIMGMNIEMINPRKIINDPVIYTRINNQLNLHTCQH